MTVQATIYLDANASTPMLAEVATAFCDAGRNLYANPSSDHSAGRAAAQAVERARVSVAALLGASPEEIVFTSGATEAINLALSGVVRSLGNRPVPVLCSQIEHQALLATVQHLEVEGLARHVPVEVDRAGRVWPEALLAVMPDGPCVVCLSHANNEIGTMNDIVRISRAAANRGAVFFVDAAQTGGYCPPDVREAPVHLVCLSAHKMHGPKGVGALFIRRGTPLRCSLHGAGQEHGLRPGTPNVPGIVGFGVAAEIAMKDRSRRSDLVTGFRNRFVDILRNAGVEFQLNGDPGNRLPGNLSLTFRGIEGAALRRMLPHLYFSQGSACSSATGRPSHVLLGIGLSEDACACTIRIGFSAVNTIEEIETAAQAIVGAYRRLRPRDSA